MRSEQSAVSNDCIFSGPTGVRGLDTLHLPNTEMEELQLLLTADGLLPNEKFCPICSPNQPLPLSEFGICRARPDGKNLYCKSCIRKKVTESRRELKEYRATRKQRQLNLLEGGVGEIKTDEKAVRTHSRKLSPTERVKLAIEGGARTQKAIALEKCLSKDAIGDALAELLLWTREIKTELVNDTRIYSLNTDKAAILEALPTPTNQPQSVSVLMSARKPDVRAGFASIRGLMPARITGQRKVG